MEETRLLAAFAADTEFHHLPPDVVEVVRIYILDNLACGLVGSRQPWSQIVAQLAQEAGASGECTVFAQSWRTSPSYAALVNGTMVGGFETDHVYVEGSCHPSAAVFPGVMALGERLQVDGKRFMVSVAVGYEAICRIGRAATRAVEDQRGFHGPATNAPFGAAVGAAKVLGLDQQGMVNALGTAGSHAGGLMEFAREGAMTKRLHVGRGAQMGLESALLAQKGFTGPTTVLEGRRGFLNVFSPSPQSERLVDGLGQAWLLKDLVLKPYACYGQHQSIIEGLCLFKVQHPLEPEAIRRVRVYGSLRMIEHHNDQEPTTIMGAQYSLPFSVAVALAKDISNPLVFNEETLWDSQVRNLAKRVQSIIDQERFGKTPGDPRAEIVVEVDEEKHSIEVGPFKGSPANPFTFEDACSKFLVYATPNLGEERALQVIEQVHRLEELPDVSPLIGLTGA